MERIINNALVYALVSSVKYQRRRSVFKCTMTSYIKRPYNTTHQMLFFLISHFDTNQNTHTWECIFYLILFCSRKNI